ncbi:Maf-like protein [Phocaeicola abscessus]|uniref:Maf-like protein n=1 Tax=Phocaeicola abscessus TaxID=555313 RepID=UPI00038615D5|nr:Maf-like protein [Phocaeicola abscessus]EPT34634.1 septum formation protein Maf [Bacteroidetes bacterium oral taxon 272 str. F0290]
MWNQCKYKIILASNSPRRKELLAGLGIRFEVKILPDIEESYPEALPPSKVAEYISRKKAAEYMDEMRRGELLITADTIVVLEGEIMGKPGDIDEARQMLRKLSGKTHQVYTGVTLTMVASGNRHEGATGRPTASCRFRSFTARTDVKMADLSTEEIDYYVTTFRPYDKAGAYGIQEWIGSIGVERIRGSYFNVMGLPVQRLYRELKKIIKTREL